MEKNANLVCGVCQNQYDCNNHVPVTLSACGHTFCRQCLIKINNGQGCINCPYCRVQHNGAAPEDLPPNRALLSFIDDKEENSGKQETPPNNPGETRSFGKYAKIGLGAAAGAAGLVVAAPIALAAVGFTSAGIAGSSLAASMMSSAAIANGGGVAAGSLVAVLQSAGPAGLGAGGTAAVSSVGAAVGGGVAALSTWWSGKKPNTENKEGNVKTDDDEDDFWKSKNKSKDNCDDDDDKKKCDDDDDHRKKCDDDDDMIQA